MFLSVPREENEILSRGLPALTGVQLEIRPTFTLFDWIKCFGVFDLYELESTGFGKSWRLMLFYKNTDGVYTVSAPRLFYTKREFLNLNGSEPVGLCFGLFRSAGLLI